MEIKGEAKLLRIFISNTDKFKHMPLYEMVVFAAKRYGLAGATVLKGNLGFGSNTQWRELTKKSVLSKEELFLRCFGWWHRPHLAPR
jgi:PII-like signaling protein